MVGDYIRPKSISYRGATKADQWEIILRVKTPLGGIYFNKEKTPLKCMLKVIDTAGNETSKTIEKSEYIFPDTVFPSCKSLSDFKSIRQQYLDNGKDPGNLPAGYYKLYGLYERWTKDQLINAENISSFNDAEKDLIKIYNIHSYGFVGYSTDLWDSYNDSTVRLRKGTRILSGGLQLAANGMPQGNQISIPLSRNVWFQHQSHVVVHFDGARPDLGRKGFQPDLDDLAKSMAEKIITQILKSRKQLRKDTGALPDLQGEKRIHDWMREQEDHESKNPIVIAREDFFLPTLKPSLTSLPVTEQDVIVLFNQLLAGGVIRGIKIMASNQHEKYDGICRYHVSKLKGHHIYDKDSNPLGLYKESITGNEDEFLSSPQILEYKYTLDSLIREFEKEEKSEKEINLVVAWTMGDNNWAKRYDVTSLLNSENIQHRRFHGATHILRNSQTGEAVLDAIILGELIEHINNPESSQEVQKKRYDSVDN